MKLEIRHLAHFGEQLIEDVVNPHIAAGHNVPDKKLLDATVTYGNEFLTKHKPIAEKDGCVIWFDVHWGEPAVYGMTWAYNPHAPVDDLYMVGEFWRMWSERPDFAEGADIFKLRDCQKAFTEYTMQHMG